MGSESIQNFMRALKKAEKNRDIEALVHLFSEEAELATLATASPLRGRAGTYRFWRDYLAAFENVETRFTRTVEGQGSDERPVAVLEWRSDGTLPSGRQCHYAGTTILDFDPQGKISRFMSYYDTAVFVSGGAKHDAA